MAFGVVFSPDGKCVVYVAMKGDKQLVVVDGQPGPEYDGIRNLVFSPDGKTVAYAAVKGDKWFVVVDGQPGPEYDQDDVWVAQTVTVPIVFSPDGKRVAYAARKGGMGFVVVDGQPGPEYDYVIPNGPAFRADATLEYLAFKDKVLYRVKHLP
jgi:roadblock/LC7 domain-containing protein